MSLLNDYPTIPMVLFSGGLDSTALLYEMLKHHKKVKVTVGEKVSHPQEEGEAKARRAILNILHNSDFRSEHGLGRAIETSYPFPTPGFKAPFLSMTQPLHWLAIAFQNLCTRTASINVGYVADDEAEELIENMQELWKSIIKTCTVKNTFDHLKGPPTLEFPLAKVSKEDIIRSLPSALLKEVTWCEQGKDCGQCPPCMLIKRVVIGMRNNWPSGKEDFFKKAFNDGVVVPDHLGSPVSPIP